MNELLQKLTTEEKARIVTGNGSWKTCDFDGKVPYVTMSDGPHGLRKQEQEEYADINKSNPATCFPTGSALASSWDLEAASAVARAIAQEALSERVSIVLGPAINIKRNPLCGRNFEYYSEDPYLAGTIAASYISAMEECGVGTSVKHFAANNQETHRQTENSLVDERALREIYLRAFEICIKKSHPATVMASYNRINGEYACANKWLLFDVLRKEWGYEGTVISDWGAAVRIIDCIRAGMDLEMPDSYGYHTREIIKAIEEGKLKEEELDRAVSSVLRMAEKYETPKEAVPCDLRANHNLACKVAAESAVLLKHTGKLPLKRAEKLLFVGQMAEKLRFQGGGSSHITTLPCLNICQAMSEKGFNFKYYRDLEALCNDKVDLSEYDKVLYFCGLTDNIESEGYDRVSLNLPDKQLETAKYLTENHDSVIFVTFGGAPFVMPFLDGASEVLHMHLGGQAVGEACAKLLAGEMSPCGKLAETWPLSIEDVPTGLDYASGTNDVPYIESIYVGYRYYETERVSVQFPFGFGLSYSTFEYCDLAIMEGRDGNITARYIIRNIGKYPAAEISQVYVIPPEKEKGRPVKELRGFSKNYIEPGQSVTVTVVLDENSFSVFDAKAHRFVKIGGNYRIAVGASVSDIRLSVDFPMRGDVLNVQGMYESETKFTTESFYKFYDKNYENRRSFDSFARGSYTVYDSMETVCAASVAGRVVLKILETVIPKITKAPADDPATKMIICAMREAPLDSLISTGGPTVKPNLTEALVLFANGHPFKGFLRLFKKP